jgi:foldase protein PrsA
MTRSIRPAAIALVAFLVLAAVALAACKQTTDALATVNGVAIPAAQVNTQLAAVEKQNQTTMTASAKQTYRAQILDSLVQLELIRQQGKKLGVDVTTKQVDDYIAKLTAQYGGEAGFAAALKQSGITMAQLRDSITSRLLVNALMAKVTPTSTITVTDAQISAYYTTNKATQFTTPAQVHAAHILFSATDTVLAQKVLAQIKAGANFAQMAAKYSKDTASAKSGGDLGWAAPTNYVPQFAQATEKMKVGSLELVKSQFGWHIIKLLGRRSAQVQSLSAVTEQIRQTLVQQTQTTAFTKYVAGLKKKADIQILDPALKKIIDAEASASASPAQ